MIEINMSKWINDELEDKLREHFFSPDSHVYVVLSYPISDMGKGTLTSHLVNHFQPDSHVLKFDGCLFTSEGRKWEDVDDLRTYRLTNPGLPLGLENWITGGDIRSGFEKEFGGRHSTADVPDVMKYFILTLCERYEQIGKPKNLMLEVGGTIHSPELQGYVMPALEYLKHRMGDKLHILLLTEMHYRTFPDESIKTLGVQTACRELKSRGLRPDLLFVREPSDMIATDESRANNETRIASQLNYRGVFYGYDAGQVVCIPYYQQEKINLLAPYLHNRFTQLQHKGLLPNMG